MKVGLYKGNQNSVINKPHLPLIVCCSRFVTVSCFSSAVDNSLFKALGAYRLPVYFSSVKVSWESVTVSILISISQLKLFVGQLKIKIDNLLMLGNLIRNLHRINRLSKIAISEQTAHLSLIP